MRSRQQPAAVRQVNIPGSQSVLFGLKWQNEDLAVNTLALKRTRFSFILHPFVVRVSKTSLIKFAYSAPRGRFHPKFLFFSNRHTTHCNSLVIYLFNLFFDTCKLYLEIFLQRALRLLASFLRAADTNLRKYQRQEHLNKR